MRAVLAFSCFEVVAAVHLRGQQHRGAEDLPLSHPLLRPNDNNLVEQVHVTGGAPDEAFITWVTDNQVSPGDTHLLYRQTGSQDWKTAVGSSQIVQFFNKPRMQDEQPECFGPYGNYTNPNCYYQSGYIHTVALNDGMIAGSVSYDYMIARNGEGNRSFSFRTPPAVGADKTVKFGIVGDLGQTQNSTETVTALKQHLDEGKIDLVLHAGDLAYADGFAPRWDSYGRLGESLWSGVAAAHTGGNHESSVNGENWINYRARYPNSYKRSNSVDSLWYSFATGPVYVITLCSYAPTGPASPQYTWLKSEVQKIDRSKTPWVIAMWHTPWYTSNAHHPMSEGAQMRNDMEGLLVASGVDVVINGHVHAYERSFPTNNLNIDCAKGVVYITIGDGGNREGFATPWEDAQPKWSAIREYAYGHALIQANGTHLNYEWHRNADPWNPDPAKEVGDTFWIDRTAKDRCAGDSTLPPV